MALGDVMSGRCLQFVEAVGRCGVIGRGGTAIGCWSQKTKLLELRFRALLDEDGTRQMELARA
jgi:hypothetical protein